MPALHPISVSLFSVRTALTPHLITFTYFVTLAHNSHSLSPYSVTCISMCQSLTSQYHSPTSTHHSQTHTLHCVIHSHLTVSHFNVSLTSLSQIYQFHTSFCVSFPPASLSHITPFHSHTPRSDSLHHSHLVLTPKCVTHSHLSVSPTSIKITHTSLCHTLTLSLTHTSFSESLMSHCHSQTQSHLTVVLTPVTHSLTPHCVTHSHLSPTLTSLSHSPIPHFDSFAHTCVTEKLIPHCDIPHFHSICSHLSLPFSHTCHSPTLNSVTHIHFTLMQLYLSLTYSHLLLIHSYLSASHTSFCHSPLFYSVTPHSVTHNQTHTSVCPSHIHSLTPHFHTHSFIHSFAFTNFVPHLGTNFFTHSHLALSLNGPFGHSHSYTFSDTQGLTRVLPLTKSYNHPLTQSLIHLQSHTHTSSQVTCSLTHNYTFIHILTHSFSETVTSSFSYSTLTLPHSNLFAYSLTN